MDKLTPHLKLAGRILFGYLLAQTAVFLNFGLRARNVKLSPTETVLRDPIMIINAAHFLLLIFLVLAFLFSVINTGELKQKQKTWMFIVAVYLIASALSFSIYWFTADSQKEIGYTRFVSENWLLIDAIEKYTADQGHPPGDLVDLYPTYYDWEATVDDTDPEEPKLQLSVPFRSIDEESSRRVTYSYQSYAGEPNPQRPVSWELTLSIYLPSNQSVTLAYNPEEIYPTEDATLIGYPREWAILGDY